MFIVHTIVLKTQSKGAKNFILLVNDFRNFGQKYFLVLETIFLWFELQNNVQF